MRFQVSAIAVLTGLLIAAAGCATTGTGGMSPEEIVAGLDVPTTTYKLDNGLTVILHEDHSDPIVSLSVMYQVGSARELKGKTGFAHLFEHILFQESENVGQDQFFAKIQNAGGTLNGFTFRDGTMYYQVVPRNALEMVMWMESDRMGFLLGALDAQAFYNQQMVVMNELKQYINNRPYGWASHILYKSLYPEGHPYSWETGGSLTDVANANLNDVKSFFKRYYGPNNAILVLAGDVRPDEVRPMIQKYFGEIPAGPPVEKMPKRPGTLTQSTNVMYEDEFALVPELTIMWPVCEAYAEDEAALDLLAEVLTEGKTAPLYKRLVVDKKLTSQVVATNSSRELAGEFSITVRAHKGGSLDALVKEIDQVLAGFAIEDVTDTRLQRIKAGFETRFYRRLETVLLKSLYLAFYQSFLGGPDKIQGDLLRYLEITPDDVLAMFKKYLRGKPRVVLSVVPKGKGALAVRGAARAVLPGDADAAPAEPQGAGPGRTATPSTFDRSVEPAQGELPAIEIPQPFEFALQNGISVTGLHRDEIPLVEFSIDIPGGHLADSLDKPGVAYFTGALLREGTASRTPAQLEEALELLGAGVHVSTSADGTRVQGKCLARNFAATMNLVREMLVEPRFDEAEFDRLTQKALTELDQNEADPNWVAARVFERLVFGEEHILGKPTQGTRESIGAITMDDIKKWHGTYLQPAHTAISVVGDLEMTQVQAALAPLAAEWAPTATDTAKAAPAAPRSAAARFYLVDVPGAQQSVINMGTQFVARNHPDYYPAFVANYPYGGAFGSMLNMTLREEKGFTYGARSHLESGRTLGILFAASQVQTDATGESAAIFKEKLEKLGAGINEPLLQFTKNSLRKSMTRDFEALGSLIGWLRNIAFFGLDKGYLVGWQKVIADTTVDSLKATAAKYFDPARMIFVVVGDLNKVREQLGKYGLDEYEIRDRTGAPPEGEGE